MAEPLDGTKTAFEYIKNNLSTDYSIRSEAEDKRPMTVEDVNGNSIDIYVLKSPTNPASKSEKKYQSELRNHLIDIDAVDEEVIRNQVEGRYTVVVPINLSAGETTIGQDPNYTGVNHHRFYDEFDGEKRFYDAVNISPLREFTAIPIGEDMEISPEFNNNTRKMDYSLLEAVVKDDIRHDDKRFINPVNLYNNKNKKDKLEIHLPENDQYNMGVIVPEGSKTFKQYINE
ncbi:MAG: hypothetical protein ACLFTH_04610 [Candidatus Woesearchaeota archaeon]